MSWDYAAYEYYLSASLLVIAMFGMGTTVSLREFGRVARAPQGILLILIAQVLISPLIAIGLARLFNLPAGVAIGILLVAALPGGMFSNFLTYLGRGNVALSVSATSLCTLGCLITTSFVLRVFGASQLPANFSMPVGRILFEILVCLMLPLVAGMSARRLLPNHFEQISKWCIRASLVLLGVVVVGALTSGRLQLSAYGWSAPVALIIFGATSVWVCYLGGKLMRLAADESFTAAVEVSVRNAHLGVLLKAALFPALAGTPDPIGDGVLFAVLCYGGISLVIAGWEVFARRHQFGVFVDQAAEPSTTESTDQPTERRAA